MIRLITYILFTILYFSQINAEIIKKIEITGNERVSDETIKIYGNIKTNQNYSESDLNKILTNLYSTNFFENVNLSLSNGILEINLVEYPVINQLIIIGEPANKIKDEI